MHKIDKFLATLAREHRLKVLAVAEQILRGDFEGLNLKKLGGTTNHYRVRVGRVRIKFTMNAEGIIIYSIGFRDDTTYNK